VNVALALFLIYTILSVIEVQRRDLDISHLHISFGSVNHVNIDEVNDHQLSSRNWQIRNFTAEFCGEQYCHPRLFLLGAAKCSTTSFWSALRRYGKGLCSPVVISGDPKWYRKEGTFFSSDNYFQPNGTAAYDHLMHYLRRYPIDGCLSENDSYFDATPSYIYNPRSSSRLRIEYQKFHLAYLRFVVIIREPVSRDLSWYKVGEGVRTDEWWEDMLSRCGSNSRGDAARCYDLSVKESIESWNMCAYNHMSKLITDTSPLPYTLMRIHGPTVPDMLRPLHNNLTLLERVYENCFSSSRLAMGIYAPQLSIWLKDWPRSQLLLMNTHHANKEAADYLQRTFAFLNLRANLSSFTGLPRENRTDKKKRALQVHIDIVISWRLLRRAYYYSCYSPGDPSIITAVLPHFLIPCDLIVAVLFPFESPVFKFCSPPCSSSPPVTFR